MIKTPEAFNDTCHEIDAAVDNYYPVAIRGLTTEQAERVRAEALAKGVNLFVVREE